ncbi:serine/threonine-protein phosphatase [Streptomyces sp. NBC_00820]|uniref:PP2C family protein-serine/threonine phosphatase n=1 Tax=Streptomyces sp. NBC_00820 TaxID=2975842 RepID=UPI002ED1C87C|nr:serine/threonine-protein phosphatase [Streptomyces sp. NBC_00820]
MIRITAQTPTARSAVLPLVWGGVAVAYPVGCPLAQQQGLGARVVTSTVFFVVGTGLICQVRRALLRELRQARRVAGAAQSVLLRPPPPRLDGLHVAAAQLSAERGASIGGDLYEAVATEYGVRVIMGDVRGHGLAALGTVAAVLGSFREAAHDEPELGRVLGRLERAHARHLRERSRADHPANGRDPGPPVAEEFVTLLLLEIAHDGEVRALNCGHPWPYLLSGTRVEPLTDAEPLPPLGPFPLPADLRPDRCGHLLPGESLVLFTDGAEDARDSRGRFFSLPAALREIVSGQPATPQTPQTPQTVLRAVFEALSGHTGGRRPTDDVAVLVLRNDRRQAPGPEARDGDVYDSAARARPAPTGPRSATRG